ncbi:dynein axonemal light chain 1-like [Condylostylus longicornis]|uniref:dynein axonemal light chain 1-like n=1 Tax=Condylostylus longicornis TaxID=2530218 RepID=UPI00244DB028|nr:dynein axonemal light chain 1-like [Condylostylus longicornis]
MSKGTTIKEALKKWEEINKKNPTESDIIELQFQFPPIEKMDSTLGTLINCKKLSLSTNMIEKISGIAPLKNLKILSLARNNIKNLNGIEVLGETLEELWISYNLIEKLSLIEQMKALKVFYIGHNMVKDWNELSKINNAQKIEDFVFAGNPIVEALDENEYRNEIMKILIYIKKLDGVPCIR